MSRGLFESLFSQLQNALSFESKAAHLRSRGHGKEKVHVFKVGNKTNTGIILHHCIENVLSVNLTP